MRIVLDTNVLVSLILGGALGVLADYWDTDRFQVIASAAIVSEYATVLVRPKFGLPPETVEAIVAYIQRKVEFVIPSETLAVISADPKDNMFLECAVSGQVDQIVSGDPHLNALKNFRNIPIVTPRDFLDQLERVK